MSYTMETSKARRKLREQRKSSFLSAVPVCLLMFIVLVCSQEMMHVIDESKLVVDTLDLREEITKPIKVEIVEKEIEFIKYSKVKTWSYDFPEVNELMRGLMGDGKLIESEYEEIRKLWNNLKDMEENKKLNDLKNSMMDTY